ncbi:hypothetical protein [Mycobacterium intracellulare]|uniref:hypothetical protein n=1 Tax=Mycobacterium intracellulare TaxID=1767 RepID=UPI000BAE8CF5|nr:hypothetical protein [Mycobacterium intracellulare]PBA56425.1 hypothetical protein CKJ57_18130 [Mycobacterium intracellulare subsp. chimaera]
MAHEENGFMEYLELQDGSDLVTKSELVSAVREAGFKLSDRQLTFYTSEGLIPLSVRAGSRVGVYPKVVTDLMMWILYVRRIGVSIDALRELLPVWKYLKRSVKRKAVDLAELELVARQHVSSSFALSALPAAVSVELNSICECCRQEIKLVDRDGNESSFADATSIGFAIASPIPSDEDEDDVFVDRWVARTRISLATIPLPPNADPTTVRLGRRANEPWPADDPQFEEQRAAQHATPTSDGGR